jgi:D-sedoheptulose 7-phosphate isomerase
MNLSSFYDSEFDEHAKVLADTRMCLREPFDRLVELCRFSLDAGGKLMFFGNGGSAGDSQHLATELAVRYKKDRPAIRAIALTTDTSALTAIGNDFGFEQLFARQIEALGQKGDVAIGISTSGRSKNVLLGLQKAREMGIQTVGLGGGTGGSLGENCDLALIVPSTTTARIQEMHITIGQMLCGALEISLGLVS